MAALLLCPVGRTEAPPGDPGLRADAPADANRPYKQELFSSAAPNLFLALAGSVAISSTETHLPAWDSKIVGILGGSAFASSTTVAVADLQTTFVDPGSFSGYPYPWNELPAYRAPSGIAAELKGRGLSMVSRANAHALDWGIDGMRATSAALDGATLAHAGAGEREGLARMATYLEEPGGSGRLALLSTATTFRPTSSALSPWGAAVGRPGISAIETETIRLVPQQQRDELQRIACQFQYSQQPEHCNHLATSSTVSLFGSRFGSETTTNRDYTSAYTLNTMQLATELHYVREAKQNSDLAILAVSSDQQERPVPGSAPPPVMLVQLAHAAMDAGADLVMVTGHAGLGPIEIYHPPGRAPRPILYGLGSLFWSPGASPATSVPEVFDSVIVRSNVDGSTVRLEIYPVDLHSGNAPDGIPFLAAPARGRAILDRLRQLSSPYHTPIEIQKYGGTVRGLVNVTGISIPAGGVPGVKP